MKRNHENVDEREPKKGSRQESTDENEPVPVEEEAVSEEFPTDVDILNELLIYYAKQEAYPQLIDIGFGLQFGDKVDAVKVLNRTMELEQEYLKMAGTSESSLVLPEDKLKFTLSKIFWHRKYGHIDQIADIELLRKILEWSAKKQDYPSGKEDAKRMKKLQKKYLSCLKIENGIAKYSMSPEDEEIFRLSSMIWGENAAGSSQVSFQESKSSGSPEEPLWSPIMQTLDEFFDIEILNCMIAYWVNNKEFPYRQSQIISMCKKFLHVDVKDEFLAGERFAGLRWKHMISSYDEEIFKLSRSIWGDTLGETCNQDSAEESSPGGEEDDTDKNKNDKKDESPKS